MPKTSFDLHRLKRDVAAEPAPAKSSMAPGGRPATGLMALVRDNIEAILALQGGGSTWAAIARALTKQGYTTGDGRELTAKALTGIVSSVRRQAVRRAAKASARTGRLDVPEPPTRKERPRLSLSPDLVAEKAQVCKPPGSSEETLRRERLDRIRDLIKKD